MARAIFAPQAEADLTEIYDFIAGDNRPAAGALIERFERQAQTLANGPGIGRARPELHPDLRSFPVGRYVLLYRPIEGGIEVARVLHGMRDLGRIFGEGEEG
jgi:toxin ParE1/3/4